MIKEGTEKLPEWGSSKADQPVCMGPYETALWASRPQRIAGFRDAAPKKKLQYALLKKGQEYVVQFSKVLIFKQDNERRRLGA